eukprot:SAG11_NODE_317_length_10836_cov_7.445469_8_plen_80_part_00
MFEIVAPGSLQLRLSECTLGPSISPGPLIPPQNVVSEGLSLPPSEPAVDVTSSCIISFASLTVVGALTAAAALESSVFE